MKTNETVESKEGVAIIVVLGMLALLMIMATTFSITMRVERVGAGGFAHNVSAENLVWAGLARAIDQIEANMGPTDPNYPANAYYPTTWSVLGSGGTNAALSLSWGEAEEHIPAALDPLPGVEWEDLQTASGSKASVAYLVMNCSGFLDANYVGGSNRLAGASVKEIQVESFGSVSSATDLDSKRLADGNYYATLQEFDILQNEPGGGLADVPDYFVTYSRYPNGSLTGTTIDEDVVDLSGDVSALEGREAEIVAKLSQTVQGLQAGDAQAIFDNLIDYVDTDSTPRNGNLGSPQTEAVPMINEVWFAPSPVQVTRQTPSTVQLSPTPVLLELCYPFVRPPTETFNAEMEIVTELQGGGETFSVTNVVSYPDPIDVPTDFGASQFRPYAFLAPARVLTAHTGVTYTLTFKCAATVSLSSGDLVDATPYPTTAQPLSFPVMTSLLDVNTSAPAPAASKEARDPRFNWNCMGGHFQDGVLHSIGAMNSNTVQHLSLPIPGLHTNFLMHVSDHGSLFSVGELGFLLRGGGQSALFRPIRLFDTVSLGGPAARDTVLDGFALTTNTVRRGLCNLNVYDPDHPAVAASILTSALEDLPLRYPASGLTLSPAEIDAIVATNMAVRATGASFANLSDIGMLDWRTLLPNRADLELTSIIAHMAGLFGTRQNLFTILVEAKPFSLGMGQLAQDTGASGWSPSKRGVFTVWRDPFPNTNSAGVVDTALPHKTFVQSFRWLTDD